MYKRRACDLPAWQFGNLRSHRTCDSVEKTLARTDQQHLRIGTVFGLRKQVGSHERRICRVVCDHQHFGRTGRHVDRGACRIGGNFELCRGYPCVARTEQLVATRHRCGAVSERSDCLRATKLEHAGHAAELSGDEDCRIGATVRARRRR